MSETKYSVTDIDRMRGAVQSLMTDWHPVGRNAIGGHGPDDAMVEDRLRTYMIAGVSPDELAAAASERKDSVWRQIRALQTAERQ